MRSQLHRTCDRFASLPATLPLTTCLIKGRYKSVCRLPYTALHAVLQVPTFLLVSCYCAKTYARTQTHIDHLVNFMNEFMKTQVLVGADRCIAQGWLGAGHSSLVGVHMRQLHASLS